MTDYTLLQEALEEDLQKTGFSTGESPMGEEPRWPGSIRGLSVPELKDLHDELMAWYDYVNNLVARFTGLSVMAKARLELVTAQAMDRAKKGKNAEERKALQATDREVVEATQELAYCKASSTIHKQRLDGLKKKMDRLSRELWLTTQHGESGGYTEYPAKFDNVKLAGFKRKG